MILTTFLFCLGMAAEVLVSDRVALPMGGRITADPVRVYQTTPNHGYIDSQEIAIFREIGQQVGVWEYRDAWFRITPPGFQPEAWVDADYLELDPSSNAPLDAPYLNHLKQVYDFHRERDLVTACAVLLEPVERIYRESPPEGGSWAPTFPFKRGDVLPVYRQQSGWYEIWSKKRSIDPPRYNSGWIPEHQAELTPKIDQSEACTREFSWLELPSYTFTSSNSYRAGPSSRLPPVAFFEEGSSIQAVAEFDGKWLATRIRGLNGLVWFQTSDAVPSNKIRPQEDNASPLVPTTSPLRFPLSGRTRGSDLRMRSEPRTSASILGMFKEVGSDVVLFEERDGWYRVTPEGFEPSAWVYAVYVEVMGPADESAPMAYLFELQSFTNSVASSPTQASGAMGWHLVLISFAAALFFFWRLIASRGRPTISPVMPENDAAWNSDLDREEGESVGSSEKGWFSDLFKGRTSDIPKQGWFESNSDYRDSVYLTGRERIVADTTGSEPKQGWFEGKDEYRSRIAHEANEHIVETASGSEPRRGWFEADEDYRSRISLEASERMVEAATGSEPRRGWFENDEEYRGRIAHEANEYIIEEATGSAPKRGWFESDEDYHARITREANEIRAGDKE